MGSGRKLGVRTLREIEITEEIFRRRYALAEPVDLLDMPLRRYVVVDGDDPKLNGVIYSNDNACLFVRGGVTADDLAEPASLALAFVVVCDLGSRERALVLHDEAPVIIKRQAEVVVTNALGRYNNVALWIAAEDDPVTGSWDVAKPKLDARHIMER